MAYSSIGDFERLLLLVLLRLDEPPYGVVLRREIAERTGRQVSPGAIYTTMGRLERRGFVASYLGEPTPERGGKRKRFYRLLPAGERALAASQEALQRLSEGLSSEAEAR